MSKYFFHYRDAVSLVSDEEGGEFSSLEEAVADANASAEDMALEWLRWPDASRSIGSIEMTAGGTVLLTVPLITAVRF